MSLDRLLFKDTHLIELVEIISGSVLSVDTVLGQVLHARERLRKDHLNKLVRTPDGCLLLDLFEHRVSCTDDVIYFLEGEVRSGLYCVHHEQQPPLPVSSL